MKVDEIKCDWLTRLTELRWEQEDDGEYYLIDMFRWENTPEGHEFWERVYNEDIDSKRRAIRWLLKHDIIHQNEDGTYFFVNEKETDKIYNE